MPDRGEAAMHMRRLAALRTVRPAKRRAAVQTIAMAGLVRLPMGGLDSPRQHRPGDRVTCRLDSPVHTGRLSAVYHQRQTANERLTMLSDQAAPSLPEYSSRPCPSSPSTCGTKCGATAKQPSLRPHLPQVAT